MPDYIATAREYAKKVVERRSDDEDIKALASSIIILCDEVASLRNELRSDKTEPEFPTIDSRGEPLVLIRKLP